MDNALNATNPPDDVVREILNGMKTIAVVGISPREDRPSNGIARFLDGRGFEVTGVNPVQTEPVSGIPVKAALADLPGPVDVVNVFRRSSAVPPVIDAALALGTGAIWLQEGIAHEEAAERARKAGVVVVQDRCIYKEWLRLMNG